MHTSPARQSQYRPRLWQHGVSLW